MNLILQICAWLDRYDALSSGQTRALDWCRNLVVRNYYACDGVASFIKMAESAVESKKQDADPEECVIYDDFIKTLKEIENHV